MGRIKFTSNESILKLSTVNVQATESNKLFMTKCIFISIKYHSCYRYMYCINKMYQHSYLLDSDFVFDELYLIKIFYFFLLYNN